MASDGLSIEQLLQVFAQHHGEVRLVPKAL